MVNRQKTRSEETRQAILKAATERFQKVGFESTTMREIAKAAGCSHATIYIYFKDKEALLHHLAMGPLQKLEVQLQKVLIDYSHEADDRLKLMTEQFIRFCLEKRNMYTIFFMTKTSQVDEIEPVLEVQKLRNRLFGLITKSLADCLQVEEDTPLLWAYSRIYFYTLHGIVGTYLDSKEPIEKLWARLDPTFQLAVEVLLAGYKNNAPQKS